MKYILYRHLTVIGRCILLFVGIQSLISCAVNHVERDIEIISKDKAALILARGEIQSKDTLLQCIVWQIDDVPFEGFPHRYYVSINETPPKNLIVRLQESKDFKNVAILTDQNLQVFHLQIDDYGRTTRKIDENQKKVIDTIINNLIEESGYSKFQSTI